MHLTRWGDNKQTVVNAGFHFPKLMSFTFKICVGRAGGGLGSVCKEIQISLRGRMYFRHEERLHTPKPVNFYQL